MNVSIVTRQVEVEILGPRNLSYLDQPSSKTKSCVCEEATTSLTIGGFLFINNEVFLLQYRSSRFPGNSRGVCSYSDAIEQLFIFGKFNRQVSTVADDSYPRWIFLDTCIARDFSLCM